MKNDVGTVIKLVNEYEMILSLIRQNGKDWLDERDIPLLEDTIRLLSQYRYLEGHSPRT